jgi:hypothetical protein
MSETAKPTIYKFAPDAGVCIGGRFNGWLMAKGRGGQWVSVRKLATEDPADSLPDWLKAIATKEPTP